MVETFRDVASSLVDEHMMSVSNRMNEIMKVLTVIATIFMPLSFVASLYGMNFDRAASPFNMPELGWRYGYPMVLLAMAVAAAGMLWFFRRKKWM
jgi:magnesium transporter